MRILFLIGLITLWCTVSCAEELRLLADNSETWEKRERPQPAETEWEMLALRAVVAKSTVSQDGLTATYVGREGSLDIVSVEEAPENPADELYSVRSYAICDGKICKDTRRKFVSKPNPEHEKIARETAQNYLNGARSALPVSYGGIMYIVEYDGKCLLTVNMKDRETQHYSFRYTRCK
jgi:hypothetical protein